MNREQINQIATMSSGTIGKALDTDSYQKIDDFIQWLYRPLIGKIVWGELAAFGENLTIALSNAVKVYKRHFRDNKENKKAIELLKDVNLYLHTLNKEDIHTRFTWIKTRIDQILKLLQGV